MFKCEFPFCEYETDERNLIHFHHIKPKELSGNNQANNRIHLCPNCHAKIFIPESKFGNHSIEGKESITILSRLLSTNGSVLHYRKSSDRKNYYYFYILKEELLE